MLVSRVFWQRNTRILTFYRSKGLDVTRCYCSGVSSLFAINKSDCLVNKLLQGYNKDARSITKHMSSHTPKIIIVGAGAAGIAAATRLLENGIDEVTILEAENRIGGRIHSVDFDGTVVDLGAQWCHGEKDNIVYSLVKDLDLLSPSTNNYTDFTFFLSDGTIIDKSVSDRLMALADEVFEDENKAREVGGTYGEYFVNEYRRRATEFGDLSESLLDWFHKVWMCLESAKSWFEVSSTGPFRYKECEGDLYLQWRQKGYKTILDVLMKRSKQLPILLNKEVNKIVWGSGVTVHCSDGTSYNCDHLILTVSLGVLKNMTNSFVPSLPPNKLNSIEAMAIGDVHKILLKFPTKWWPDDVKGFSFVWSETDKRNLRREFPYGPSDNGKSWLEDIYGFYVIDDHPNVLLGWAVGKMLKDVEEIPDEVVTDACMFLLRKFVGKLYSITEPNAILRSKWRNNPHFNGCYTYLCLEAEKRKASFEDLANPVLNGLNKPVLLFAGEGTHSYYYSTVHGAIETGYREADRILGIYKSGKLIHRKVAIIGAGMAGLASARTLHSLGCTDFVVIEAESELGGRIRTQTFDDNILELGAQWIHGTENPLYELARRHDLLSETTSEEGLGLYIRDNGEIIDGEIVKRVDFEVGRILSDCEKFVSTIDYPQSVGEFMETRFAQHLNKCHDCDEVKELKWELFDWHVRFQIVDNSCLDLKQLSAKAWGQYICIDDKAHVNLKRGFNELVDVLVEKLPKNSLLLSTPVAEIQRRNNSNKIICDNGTIVYCDYLIITVSLGVLKRLKITPPLPPEISETIRDLGFDPIGKIFLIFDHKWWDVEGFQFIWRRSSTLDDESSWVRDITGFDSILHGPRVLLGWVGGEGVKVMEKLSEEEVGRDCMKLLRRFIRSRTIPNPVKVIRSTWFSNPYVSGGYSHATPACDRSGLSMQELSKPIFVDGKPRILIAGEAANPAHFSTIHGAYESGQEQAELLAEYIMPNSKL